VFVAVCGNLWESLFLGCFWCFGCFLGIFALFCGFVVDFVGLRALVFLFVFWCFARFCGDFVYLWDFRGVWGWYNTEFWVFLVL